MRTKTILEQGLPSFFLLLDLITDADKYKESIQTLRQEYEKANEAILLVGPAEEIQTMRSQAKADRDVAKRLLEKTQDEVADIRTNQKAFLDNEKEKLRIETLKLEQQRHNQNIIFKKRQDSLDSLQRILKDKQGTLERRTKEANDVFLVSNKIKKEYLDKIEALKQTIK